MMNLDIRIDTPLLRPLEMHYACLLPLWSSCNSRTYTGCSST